MDSRRSSSQSQQQTRSQMRSCSFTFSSHGRIPQAKMQTILTLGFKVGYNKDGHTSFESTNPSRSAIISLFDMIGFHDNDKVPLASSVMPDYLTGGGETIMPSLEPFSKFHRDSASFEVLGHGSCMGVTGSGESFTEIHQRDLCVNFQGFNAEIERERGAQLQISDDHFKRAFTGNELEREKQIQEKEGTGVMRHPCEDSLDTHCEREDKEKVKLVERISGEEHVTRKQQTEDDKDCRYRASEEVDEEGDDEDDDEEEDEEEDEEITFNFEKPMFDLFRKSFKESNILECVKITQGPRGNISVSVRNCEVSNEINKFRKKVEVKKIISADERDLEWIVNALTTDFDEHVVIVLNLHERLLKVTACRNTFETLKRQYPKYF